MPGPIGSIRKQSSPASARQSDIGRGSTWPGGWSMKNCPGIPGSSGPAATRSSVYGPIGSVPVTPSSARRCASVRAGHAPVPIRSCSESAVSARAFAIACTAAAAPEIVVMHGTRALSAASRMR